MNLLALQRGFGASIRDGAGEWPGTSGAGLAVYRNNYRAQLLGCLKETYQRVHLWLGEEQFDCAAQAYIDAMPPNSWTLDAYGRDFSIMLQMHFPDDPEVSELAWIDGAFSDAFVAADCEPLSSATLGAPDWEKAYLRFNPSMNCTIAKTNAAAIWNALAVDEAPPAAELLAEEGGYLVWRSGLIPCFRGLERQEFGAISLLYSGVPFSGLCEAMVNDFGMAQGTRMAGELLGRWLGEGLVAVID